LNNTQIKKQARGKSACLLLCYKSKFVGVYEQNETFEKAVDKGAKKAYN